MSAIPEGEMKTTTKKILAAITTGGAMFLASKAMGVPLLKGMVFYFVGALYSWYLEVADSEGL